MIRLILARLLPSPPRETLASHQHPLFAADTDPHDMTENYEWHGFLREKLNLPERLRPFDGDYGDE